MEAITKIVIARGNNFCSALKGKAKYQSVAFRVHFAALKTSLNPSAGSSCALMHSLPELHFHLPILPSANCHSSSQSSVIGCEIYIYCPFRFCLLLCFCLSLVGNYPFTQPRFHFAGKQQILRAVSSHFF